MLRKAISTICLATCCGLFVASGSAGEEENQPPDLYTLKSIPKAWIGVRIDQVPCELKSHLKRGELMLVNIAENSPAKRAGLDRYDVVLSFNGQPITDMDVFLKAIQRNGTGKPATIVVIHQGKEATHAITPELRDSTQKLTYIYEEEPAVETAPVEKYFGHSAKIGPDGVTYLSPQGRLDQLPDDIKNMLEGLPREFEDFAYYRDLDSDENHLLWSEEERQHVNLTLTIQEDDEKTTIKRDADGVFTIERSGPEESSTKTYENKDELREGDPEAYKLFQRSFGVSTFVLPPDWNNLTVRQRQFQKELLDELKRTEERAKKDGEQSKTRE